MVNPGAVNVLGADSQRNVVIFGAGCWVEWPLSGLVSEESIIFNPDRIDEVGVFGERDVLTEDFGDRGEVLFESFPT